MVLRSLLGATRSSKFDIVANVVRPFDDLVVEGARPVIVFMRVPIDAPPALLPPKRQKFFDQSPACPSAARVRPNKDILEIANHLEAPGVGMQHVIGEPLWRIAITAGKHTLRLLI